MESAENELKKEALVARVAFENRAISSDLLKNLYRVYNSAIEIDSFLNTAAEIFPRLNCGVATVYLRHKLQGGDIIAGSYDGRSHTFLRLGGFIVDITADQFGGPEVYVGPVQPPWSLKTGHNNS